MGLIAWFRREGQWRREHIAAFSEVAEKQRDGLTVFQHQTILEVAKFVAPESFKRVGSDKGDGDYLVAPLGNDGSELYIYPNEAAIFGKQPYAWFEEWDYRTPAELLKALIEECSSRGA